MLAHHGRGAMVITRTPWQWIAAGILLTTGTGMAQALEPGDIAVIYITKSAASQQIAKYYMKARKIPDLNLVPVTCDVGETIPEAVYRSAIVPQVIKGLGDRKLLPDPRT